VIDYKAKKDVIVNSLQEWLKQKGYTCPVVLANQVTPVPEYPYISFTVINPIVENRKGYSVTGGTRFKPLSQIWSFTVQSDKNTESVEIALHAYDWFASAGLEYLGDNGIAVQRIGNINNRDNLLSIEYEYRNGFDVTFSIISTVDDTTGVIEEAIITANREVIIDVTKEV